MSDFVNNLTQFCATPDDGTVLSLGGRVQMAVFSEFEKTLVRMLLAWFPTAGYAVDPKFESSLKEKWGL